MLQNFRYGLRMMRRSPGFTAVSVLTLALGIGANTAIFSVVNALLLRALPLRDPARLTIIRASYPQRNVIGVPMSVAAHELIRDRARSYAGVTAYAFDSLTLTGIAEPEQLTAARVAPDFFDVTGARPILGRAFQPAEGVPGGPAVALISESLWHRRFNSDPAILGKPVTLGQNPYTVIGVMPSTFTIPTSDTDVWISKLIEYAGLQPDQIRQGAGFLVLIGRLANGVTLDRANGELTVLASQYRREHPTNTDADPNSRVDSAPLQESLTGAIRPTLLILAGAVGLVLLIACANVASLMLARSTGRAKEIAMRAALGAGRGVLIRQLLAESVLLSAAGAVAGIVLAQWGVDWLNRGNVLPDFHRIGIDLPVLAFTLAIAILAGIFFGLVPALHASRPDLNALLRESTGSGSLGRHRTRAILVAAQMALSIVLLIGAALLVQSFRRLLTLDPGFNPRNALALRVSLPPTRYPDDARRSQFIQSVVTRMQSVPGVQAASASMTLPLNVGVIAPILAEGQPVVPITQRQAGIWNGITPGYFAAAGIPILRGRDFTWADDAGAPKAVIISDSIARRFWPNQNPVGHHFTYARRNVEAEVVGVVGNVKTSALEADAGMVFYTPYAQFALPRVWITLRTAADPRAFFNTARAQVFAADRDQPVTNLQTLEERLTDTLAARKQTMYLIGVFAVIALLLATIGLYGVMSYSVAQRRAEIGIRQAIGACRSDILRLVLLQGLKLSLAGIAAGAIAAVALTRLIGGLLYRTSPTDPVLFGAICAIFLAVALAASYIPAWRATRIDPLTALRSR